MASLEEKALDLGLLLVASPVYLALALRRAVRHYRFGRVAFASCLMCEAPAASPTGGTCSASARRAAACPASSGATTAVSPPSSPSRYEPAFERPRSARAHKVRSLQMADDQAVAALIFPACDSRCRTQVSAPTAQCRRNGCSRYVLEKMVSAEGIEPSTY